MGAPVAAPPGSPGTAQSVGQVDPMLNVLEFMRFAASDVQVHMVATRNVHTHSKAEDVALAQPADVLIQAVTRQEHIEHCNVMQALVGEPIHKKENRKQNIKPMGASAQWHSAHNWTEGAQKTHAGKCPQALSRALWLARLSPRASPLSAWPFTVR